MYQKLGICPGFKIALVNPPTNYLELLGGNPEPIQIGKYPEDGPFDFIHFFPKNLPALEEGLYKMQNEIVSNGMIWISWLKKASKIPTDLNEGIIRDTALALKLVDVKVCSVSQEFSALKLVIRKALR